MARSFTKWQRMVLAQALLVAVALVLSIVSSLTAYAMSGLPVIVAACVVTLVLDAAAIVAKDKLPAVVQDGMFFVDSLLIGLALCTVLSGRVLLIGDIYFSDLESSNPVAILAMNLAIAAWVFYALAIAANCVLGFSRQDKR